MPLFGTGAGGGAAALTASPASFLANTAAGATIATLGQPFGAGTTFATVGTVPAQLALGSGGAIVAGTGAAAGTSYAIKVRATSADARREVAETLSLLATAAAAAEPAAPVGTGGPAALPTTPAARWHPAHSSVTTSAGRVVSASDIQGLAGVSEGAAGIGPLAMTDAVGRKFWRFDGASYLNVAGTLAGDIRAAAVFMVGRHLGGGTVSYFGFGNAAAGTTANTGAALMSSSSGSGTAPYLRGSARASSADAANAARVIVGHQLQLMGVVGRTTANGNQRLYLNGDAATVAQSSVAASNVAGAEIGRYPFSPGSSGSWGAFDLYEMVVYTGTLTNAQADAIAAALVSAWSIPAVTSQLVLEGDSITAGSGLPSPAGKMGMVLTDPGSAIAMPDGWRVTTLGISGSTVASVSTRRDIADTIYDKLLPGRNVLGLQIGRNDFTANAASGGTVYSGIVGLLNTASTGYLQRGWEVRQAINIASSSSIEPAIQATRTALRAAAFLTDAGAGAGQPYEGRLARVEMPQIAVAGSGTIFDTSADAADTLWYQGDATHPTAAGALEMARAYRAAL